VIKCLAGHRADLGIKDARGHTAVDVAMGRAEGHGRGGAGKVIHPVTPASQLL
jgi:hypothetical protein